MGNIRQLGLAFRVPHVYQFKGVKLPLFGNATQQFNADRATRIGPNPAQANRSRPSGFSLPTPLCRRLFDVGRGGRRLRRRGRGGRG